MRKKIIKKQVLNFPTTLVVALVMTIATFTSVKLLLHSESYIYQLFTMWLYSQFSTKIGKKYTFCDIIGFPYWKYDFDRNKQLIFTCNGVIFYTILGLWLN